MIGILMYSFPGVLVVDQRIEQRCTIVSRMCGNVKYDYHIAYVIDFGTSLLRLTLNVDALTPQGFQRSRVIQSMFVLSLSFSRFDCKDG